MRVRHEIVELWLSWYGTSEESGRKLAMRLLVSGDDVMRLFPLLFLLFLITAKHHNSIIPPFTSILAGIAFFSASQRKSTIVEHVLCFGQFRFEAQGDQEKTLSLVATC
jgi:hypothetical protein